MCKRGKKKREKNFIRYFPEERGLHPLTLCHMATKEEQPWGPLTNSVVPSGPPRRASPAGPTFANASLPQPSHLMDKPRLGIFSLFLWLHLLGLLVHLSSSSSFSESLSPKAQGKEGQTAADKLGRRVLQKQIKKEEQIPLRMVSLPDFL